MIEIHERNKTFKHEYHHGKNVDKFDMTTDFILGGSKFCLATEAVVSALRVNFWTSSKVVLSKCHLSFERFFNKQVEKVNVSV